MENNQVRGIIPNVHAGLLGQKAFNIIITETDLIIAQMTSAMVNQEIKKVKEESKNTGEGFLKRMASTMTVGYHIHERYFSMSPEQILNETPGNMIISNNSIKKIRIEMGRIYEEGKSQPNTLKIVWDGGKLKYAFTQITVKQAKELLTQTLGSKVK
jgi:hypothetical protein